MNTKNIYIILLLFFAMEGIAQVNPTAALKPGTAANQILITRDTFSADRFIYKSILFDLSNDSLRLMDDIKVDLSGFRSSYDVLTTSAVAAMDAPVNSKIYVYETGAQFVVSSTPLVWYNNNTADGVAVIAMNNGNYAYLKSYTNSYNIKWFGAVGDGTTSDNAAFTKAADYANGATIFLTSDTFNIATSVTLPSNTKIVGTDSTVVKGYFVINETNNTQIKNIKFIRFNATDWTYGVRIQGDGGSNLLIDNCKFDKTLVYQDAPTTTSFNGVTILNSDFDYTGNLAAVVSIQLHASNVMIDKCNFSIYNLDGCLKLSDGSGYSYFTNNNVVGSLDEEVWDFYSNVANVVCKNNTVDLDGGGFIAGKSGTVGDPNPYPYFIDVSNNFIRKRGNSGSLIYLSGAFALSFEDSTQIANVTENMIIIDSLVSTGTAINVRGFHSAVIKGNSVKAYYEYAGTGIYSCAVKDLNISNNIIGSRILLRASANPSGVTYGTNLNDGQWEISNNIITQYSGGAYGIYLYDQDSISVNIHHNTIKAIYADNSYGIRLTNSDLIDLQLKDNMMIISGLGTSNANRTEYASCTYNTKYESGNSWDALQWISSGTDIYNANTGNVGINFNSPGEKLEVGGKITAANDHGFVIGNTDETYKAKIYSSQGQLYLEGNGQTTSTSIGNTVNGKMFKFNYNGRLGIGTQSPSEELHVVGDSRFENRIYDGNNSQGTAGQVLSTTGSIVDWVDISSDNLYNTDGTLTGNRIITSTGQSLTFSALDGTDINTTTFSDSGNDFSINDTGSGALSAISHRPEYLKLSGSDFYIKNDVNDQLLISDTETNSTAKTGSVSTPHYTNSEEPFTFIIGESGSALNELHLGGGDSGGNAAGTVSIYTAANNTTTTGTLRMKFLDTGDIEIYSDLVIDEANNVRIVTGTGSPEGSVTAGIGSTFHRTNGATGTSFYVKESGTGNTGWAAK